MGKNHVISQWSRKVFSFQLCIALAGCSGYRQYFPSDFPVWPPAGQKEIAPVEVGNRVKVLTAKGVVVGGTLIEYCESEILVGDVSVPYEEIESIQLRSILIVPTTAAVFTYGALAFLFYHSGGSFSPDDH